MALDTNDLDALAEALKTAPNLADHQRRDGAVATVTAGALLSIARSLAAAVAPVRVHLGAPLIEHNVEDIDGKPLDLQTVTLPDGGVAWLIETYTDADRAKLVAILGGVMDEAPEADDLAPDEANPTLADWLIENDPYRDGLVANVHAGSVDGSVDLDTVRLDDGQPTVVFTSYMGGVNRLYARDLTLDDEPTPDDDPDETPDNDGDAFTVLKAEEVER